MTTYILHVTVITTVCFLFYKLMLQKETFYRLNRWTLMTCLAISFCLPLLPVPQNWSWRTKFDQLAAAARQWTRAYTGAQAPKTTQVAKALLTQKTAEAAKAALTSKASQSAKATQPAKATESPKASHAPAATPATANPTTMQAEFSVNNPPVIRQVANVRKPSSQAKLAAGSVNRFLDPGVARAASVERVADSSRTIPDSAGSVADLAWATAGSAKKVADEPSDKVTETQLLRPETMATAGTPAGEGKAGTLAGLFSRVSLFRLLKGLFSCYSLGVLLFGLNFLFQLVMLLYQSYRRPVIKDGRFRIVEISGDRAPCSFGNTIFINPDNYDWETYNQILIHEKIHVSSRHTLDIVLAELALVVQWFNPFAWLYRREVENNLEFLTDASVLLHREVERSAYQLSLLRVSAPQLSFSLTNNYNQSLLKRRIIMMNSKRSSLHTIWKYFFLIPIFTALVCILNRPVSAYGAAAKQLPKRDSDRTDGSHAGGPATFPGGWFMGEAAPATADTTKHPARSGTDSTANKPGEKGAASSGNRSSDSDGDRDGINYRNGINYSNAALDAAAQDGMSAENVQERETLDFERAELQTQLLLDDMSAQQGQVAIKAKNFANAHIMADPQVQIALAKQDMLRQSVKVDVDLVNVSRSGMKNAFRGIGDSDLREGSWFATSSNDRISFELKAENEDHSWSSGFTVEKSEITPFPGSGTVEFKLIREAGTISFKGQFDGQEGFGHFHFIPDAGYYAALKQMGVEDLDDRRQFSYFTVNIKKDYVNMLVHNGYAHISSRDLISFAAMHIDQEFIQYWHGSGLVDADEPRNLIAFKALHIDRLYVDELKAAGYDHLDMRDLQSMKAQHIDRAYIRSLGRGEGEDIIPVRDLVTYKALHIDSAYLDGLRKVGYDHLSRNEIASLYSMHIMPEYIKSLQDLGYKDLSIRDLTNLRAMHVTTEDIKGFQDIGWKDLDVRQLTNFRAMKITPEFVKGFQNIGYKELDAHKLSSFKSMGVTPEFIKGFTDMGYDDISAGQLSSLKAMGVTPEYVKAFKAVGFEHIPVNQLTSLKAMGVNADYISKMRAKGFDSKDLNKYIRLKNDFN